MLKTGAELSASNSRLWDIYNKGMAEINRAKARGRKPDYEYYYYTQDFTDPKGIEAQRQWRKKAGEVFAVSVGAGAIAAAISAFGPDPGKEAPISQYDIYVDKNSGELLK